MSPLIFSVSYSLGEYLSFVQDHAVTVIAKQAIAKGKAPRVKLSWFARGLVIGFSSIMFFFKKRRMPVCEFMIDELHIARTSAAGRLVVPWLEVVAVQRYSQGYLVEKSNGAMPLPYRCLSSEQASVLAALIERRESALRESSPAAN